ncbi:MAG TPA: hypothetical protein VGG16_16305 [Streptosporangiaceae bacterium]|jgi:hypothetical protein
MNGLGRVALLSHGVIGQRRDQRRAWLANVAVRIAPPRLVLAGRFSRIYPVAPLAATLISNY